jgi:cephalosporin hydroxylase
MLILLNSDHTHPHVFYELNSFIPLISIESIVIWLIQFEEMPIDCYQNKSWASGNNLFTALNDFLEIDNNFKIDKRWSRKSLMGEFRDGIAIKIT